MSHRVVPVKICGSVCASDDGDSEGDNMLDGSDGLICWEKHSFIRWMEILGGKNWMRGRIFCMLVGIRDDRKFMTWVSVYFGGRRFCGEKIVCVGGVGW